jgi:hypothetical protein
MAGERNVVILGANVARQCIDHGILMISPPTWLRSCSAASGSSNVKRRARKLNIGPTLLTLPAGHREEIDGLGPGRFQSTMYVVSERKSR